MKRAALYCRVSTEEQARYGLSLETQRKTLVEYAETNEYKIIDTYLDEGVSARKRYLNRPELTRLLNDVKADRIDVVLFTKLDRWIRNVGDYYEIQKILEGHNVVWQAVSEDYETITASGRFKVNIMLSVAQDEADRTSERIKAVFDGKRERNEPLNNSVPRGYRIEGKEIVLDAEKAPLVRKAFDVYLSTGSVTKAIRAVPALNLDYCSAHRIFSYTAYMGDFHGIQIPAIITPEEHEQALALFRHGPRRTKENRVYIFSGLLYCSECGRRMGGHNAKNTKAGEVQYYMCVNHAKLHGCSNGKYYRQDEIESFLLSHIDSEVQATVKARKKSSPKSYQAERDSIKRKLSKLSELYVAELISMDDYKRQYEDLTAELAAVPEDESPLDADAVQEIFFKDWQTIYNDLPADAKQVFWRKAVSRIVVAPDGSVQEIVLN